MYVFLTILIIAVCVFLILAVLVQNPKGGGLSAAFGGMGNQVMGARRSADFIEKATWTLVISLLVLSLASGIFMPSQGRKETQKSEIEDKVNQTNFPLPTTTPDEQQQPPSGAPANNEQQPAEEQTNP
ncbi:MAG TPA: preprotein translocase subunit SecG [Chitinophagales bacterium]|nr:preprotein translocase subunit SecG [Chitinophagales bacterium]